VSSQGSRRSASSSTSWRSSEVHGSRLDGGVLRDGWNIFDLVIVIAALIPASNGIGPMLRILRVFRVLRLVKTIPELRLIVTVLLRSVASMKYVALLAASSSTSTRSSE
jgi:hypothetical protein